MVYYVVFKFVILLLKNFTVWFIGCLVPHDLVVLVNEFASGF